MKRVSPVFLEAAILLYCFWNARDLLAAWHSSAYDRYGWLAMLIWCASLLLSKHRLQSAGVGENVRLRLLGAGLLFSFAGLLSDLNILQHIGLAVALTASIAFAYRHLLWLVVALAWMPALGWFGQTIPPEKIVLVRLLAAAATVGLLILCGFPRAGRSA